MELSQEHFDKQFEELNKRLDSMATKAELAVIREEIVTKTDLDVALRSQTKELEAYTDAVAATILEAVDEGFTTVNKRRDRDSEKQTVMEKDIKKLKSALHMS